MLLKTPCNQSNPCQRALLKSVYCEEIFNNLRKIILIAVFLVNNLQINVKTDKVWKDLNPDKHRMTMFISLHINFYIGMPMYTAYYPATNSKT